MSLTSILKRPLVSTVMSDCASDNVVFTEGKGHQFLTASEEQLLCQYYMKKLLEFCHCFRPPVPRSVLVGNS